MANAVAEVERKQPPDLTTARGKYADEFNGYLRNSVQTIIEAGRSLVRAKEALAHGEFTDMLEHDLLVGPRTAQKLMAVGQDERLTNTTIWTHLPPTWTTLYELTRLDDKTLETAVKDGTINPDMLGKDAKALNPVNQRAKEQDGERRAMKDLSDAHSDPHGASDTDTATLVQERDEALQNAQELAQMLEATQYANAGAEDAAKRIMVLDQEILALKATNARLQEQNAELMRAVKYWKKLAKNAVDRE